MILGDIDIEFFRELGHLDITPWHPDQLQPASYDLTLAPYVTYLPKYGHPTPRTQRFEELRQLDASGHTTVHRLGYCLAPGEFALFSTVETVTLSAGVSAQVAGKSTWARKGLIVESAGWVDPGFEGQLTLELKNLTDEYISLVAGAPICQIVFMEMRRPALHPYGERGRYQHQTGPTAAR